MEAQTLQNRVQIGARTTKKSTQIVTRNLQNGLQKPPKWRPKPSKIEPKLGQEGARTTQKAKNNIDPTKRGAAPHRAPHFGGKCGQHGPKLGPKMEPKSIKNRCKNRSKNRCLSRSIFEAILVDFGRENGGKLAPKSDQKSKPPLKRKNQLNTSRLMFSWLSGLQVGSKNRSKIDQKRSSTWEGILASIFERFWWILGGKLGSKIEQKSIKRRST